LSRKPGYVLPWNRVLAVSVLKKNKRVAHFLRN